MGILAFVLIFIPESNDGSAMHLLRAESPGPQVGKIVSKMKVTTGILYLIYFGLTVLEVGVLMLDKPLLGYESEHLFFSVLTALGCAGTGGFGFIPGSMEMMNPFTQYTVSIFLLLFGCNFGLYYLLLIGKVKVVLKSEEFRTYLGELREAGLLDGRVVAVAGTATSIVSMREQMVEYDSSRVHRATVTTADIDALLERLAAMTTEERRHVVGLDPGRAPVIVAGLLILKQIMALAGADSFTVSECDILHGIIMAQVTA
jgi:hypothetical protein